MGDVSICIECAQVNLFDENLRLRKPTAEEMVSLRASPEWSKVERHQTAVRAVNSPKIHTQEIPTGENGIKRLVGVRCTRL